MSRKSVSHAVRDMEVLTQEVLKNCRRIRPEFTLELLAWLLMRASRHDDLRHGAMHRHREDPELGHDGLAKYHEHAAKCLRVEAGKVCDWFSRNDWNITVAMIRKQIPEDTPIPSSIYGGPCPLCKCGSEQCPRYHRRSEPTPSRPPSESFVPKVPTYRSVTQRHELSDAISTMTQAITSTPSPSSSRPSEPPPPPGPTSRKPVRKPRKKRSRPTPT